MNSREDPAGWWVFRCSGSETGDLEEKLSESGHTVWTPRTWYRKRVPRKKVYRDILMAMLPSYLFVSQHADLDLLASLGAKHGFWGPMAIRGVRVLIKDADLAGLRAADDRTSAPRKWVEPIPEPVHLGPISQREQEKQLESPRGLISSQKPAHTTPGGGRRISIPQDAHRKGAWVKLTKGPLGSLGLEGRIEEVRGQEICISAFGGRIWMPAADVEGVTP